MAQLYLSPQPGHGLYGPHLMKDDLIKKKFDDADFGVYMLGKIDPSLGRIIRYVGRGNLKDRLRAHLDDEHWENTFFYYGILQSRQQTFLHECRLFHLQGKGNFLDNEIHPPRLPGSKGPKCSELGCSGEVFLLRLADDGLLRFLEADDSHDVFALGAWWLREFERAWLRVQAALPLRGQPSRALGVS